MKPFRIIALMVGLTLIVAGVSLAQAAYQIQPIVQSGDRAGGVLLKKDASFFIGALNDRGQILFVTDNAAGGQALIQYTDNELTPIVAAGGDAPNGKWSSKTIIPSPASMNQRGDAVFTADVTVGDKTDTGTFRWDYAARRVTPVVLNGMPAVQNLTLEAGGSLWPTINNREEIALAAAVRSRAGQPGDAVFFLGLDDRLLPVALPDEELPESRTILSAVMPSLTDDGRVAMLARAAGESYPVRPCLWEQGAFAQLAVGTTKALGARHFLAFTGVWANNKNHNLLLSAHLHGLSGASNAPYFLTDGQFVPVFLPGQPLPDGGRFQTIQPQDPLSLNIMPATGVSAPNDAGEHVILVLLENNGTAAYLMGVDGKLTPILRSGTVTKLGKIASVGLGAGKSQGVGLNNKGQVALTVHFVGGHDTVVLLTPAAP